MLTEEEIEEGIALCVRHTHNLAEGAGAAPIMAALKRRNQLQGKTDCQPFMIDPAATRSTMEVQ